MSDKQGPVFIEEPCGCRVDHGIPYRCAQHQVGSAPVSTQGLATGPMSPAPERSSSSSSLRASSGSAEVEQAFIDYNLAIIRLHESPLGGASSEIWEAVSNTRKALITAVESDQSQVITSLQEDLAWYRVTFADCDQKAYSRGRAEADAEHVEVITSLRAEVEQLKDALKAEGIVEEHGAARWVFKPNLIEVSASGGDSASRLGGVLRQARYVVDELHRRAEAAEASLAALQEQILSREDREQVFKQLTAWSHPGASATLAEARRLLKLED